MALGHSRLTDYLGWQTRRACHHGAHGGRGGAHLPTPACRYQVRDICGPAVKKALYNYAPCLGGAAAHLTHQVYKRARRALPHSVFRTAIFTKASPLI